MPARDRYHEAVKNAFVKDGWTITDDPLRLRLRGRRNLFIDLGAERLLAAEKDTRKIAVEIKSFLGPSDIHELELAVGQFVVYSQLLHRHEPERVLYLAIPESTRLTLFEEEVGEVLLANATVRIVSYDPEQEVLVKWNP